MDTKTALLRLLEQQRGAYVSGQQAAAQLGVSRAAVWKAAQALRRQGLPIEGAPGSGYLLAAGSDVLSEEALRAFLPGGDVPVRMVGETGSTNEDAKRWALDGAPHGSLVVASGQRGGKGRRGRGFESPAGGLYMSVVLRPQQANPATAARVTAVAAVAACRAVAALCKLELGIKWVNDLYLHGKKCCGILCESATDLESASINYLVVGIGINYNTPQKAFSMQMQSKVTSVYPNGGAPVPRAALIADIHTRLLALFDALPDDGYLEEYRRRSVVLGRAVTVLETPPYEAEAVAIDDEARLVVRLPGGEEKRLHSGEISVAL